MSMISGKVAFSNLTQHDFYQGKNTGNFTLTVTLDDDSAKALEAEGVRLKTYEDTQQRKFKSAYPTAVLNMDNSAFQGEIPRGSVVRVLYKTGPENKEWGTPVYMEKIRVVEVAENTTEVPEEF